MLDTKAFHISANSVSVKLNFSPNRNLDCNLFLGIYTFLKYTERRIRSLRIETCCRLLLEWMGNIKVYLISQNLFSNISRSMLL